MVQTSGYATALLQLTALEKAVIYHYTHTGLLELNQALHTNGGRNDSLFGQALAMALAKLPPYSAGVVHSAAWLDQATLATLQQAAASGEALDYAAPNYLASLFVG